MLAPRVLERNEKMSRWSSGVRAYHHKSIVHGNARDELDASGFELLGS